MPQPRCRRSPSECDPRRRQDAVWDLKPVLPRFSAVSGVRHARGAAWIGRVGGIRVSYYLFAPQGRAERPEGPASSQAVNKTQDLLRMV